MRNASPQRYDKRKKEPPKRRQSAELSQFSWRDRLEGWLAHHRESSKDALQRLRQRPVPTFITLITLAIALALPAGLSLIVQNIHDVTGDWGARAHLSVFLQQGTDSDLQRSLAQEWRQKADIDEVTLITPDEALQHYRKRTDNPAILQALPTNPLPPVLVIYPSVSNTSQLIQLQQQLKATPQVDKVVLDVAWIRKLQAFIALANNLVSALTLILAAGIILVINNTLQLAIENRRDEIIVMKTVGGTNAFVRRPFLYTGFWYGVGGGVLALILIGIGFLFVGRPAETLLHLYGNQQGLSGLPLSTFLLLPVLAGFLGLAGAFLAVSRHLHDLEPRQF